MNASIQLRGIAIAVLLLVAVPVAAETPTHARHFKSYEGTETCLACHEDQAREFFGSQHYQWQGSAEALTNDPGHDLGKMNMINDFCTNPAASWIGQVKNAEGKVLASGCSACHAGRGLKPERNETEEQLNNIDCLMCHANGYRRAVYQNDDGDWEWKPILWKNKEGLDSVSKRITTPTRGMCLRCHNSSGGGANIKRGDMEYTLAKPSWEFDVHMGTDGADMPCTSCHAEGGHRVIGRGVDLASNDSPGKRLQCSTACHDEEPHESRKLNRHTERIECSTCHIPRFARDQATEMARDWSKPVYIESLGKYAPTQVLEQDVIPVYAWYNGKSWMQLAGEPVELNEAGQIQSAIPIGDWDDPMSKITPFKRHEGVMPVSVDQNWLLPIAVDEVFSNGEVGDAIKHATRSFYKIDDVEFKWVPTVRYMSISHGVQPADNALDCDDCHDEGGRMDWQALGYAGDPKGSR